MNGRIDSRKHSMTRSAFPTSAIGAALALAGAAQADALSTPSLSGPLTANPNPYSFEAGPLGNIYVSGAASGLAWIQDNPFPGDRNAGVDLSNAQIFVQKSDGLVQFYLEAGAYALPSLGTQYGGLTNAWKANSNFFGPVPVGYLKLAPSSDFNVIVGALPTLVGAESTFTFQNMNIERGLLWNQEPAVSKGVQANYAKGPWTVSLSLNDGFYSGKFNWLSGSAAYAFSQKDTVTFVGAGNFGSTNEATPGTPLLQNNGSIYNLIWTHSEGALTVTPYVQYSHVDKNPSIGIPGDASTIGGAVLARYTLTKTFSLAGRGEYISSSGSSSLLYGPHSKAWSLTLTPTWQLNKYFVRAEASYTKAEDAVPGFAFGRIGAAASQTRGMIETGVLF